MKLTVVVFKNTIQVIKLRELQGKLDPLLSSRGCILKWVNVLIGHTEDIGV